MGNTSLKTQARRNWGSSPPPSPLRAIPTSEAHSSVSAAARSRSAAPVRSSRSEFFRRLSSWAMTASARARVTAIRPRVEPINILSDASVQLSLQPLPEPSKSRKSLRISHSEINKKCFSLSVVKGLARSANLPPLESKGREPPRRCLVHQRNWFSFLFCPRRSARLSRRPLACARLILALD